MRQIWVISDTHFLHENIKKYENRPEDFNEILITNWNAKVNQNDLVIHLGDVIFGEKKHLTLPPILASLNGTKVLCLGNHDNHPPSFYLEAGFDFVCDYFVLNRVAFSHAPLTPIPSGAKLNIHGHFHRGVHRNPDIPDRYYDAHWYKNNTKDYYLIQIEDTLSPFLLSDIDDGVFSVRKK